MAEPALARPRLPLARPDVEIEQTLAEIAGVLRSGTLTRGPAVAAFERACAERLGCAEAVAVSSGTAALHLALLALGLDPRDEVIVPDYTFPASANAVCLAGARVAIADVAAGSLCLDVAAAERARTPRTRMVMAVHQFGAMADILALRDWCRREGLVLLEDAACAFGATAGGEAAGTIGHAACFSFHPRKPLTTAEGGLVTTGDAELAERIRRLRHHGLDGEDIEAAGYNYRLSDVHAAIGLVQLRHLDRSLAARAEAAAALDRALQGHPALAGRQAHAGGDVWQSYVVWLRPGLDLGATIAGCRARGVETAPGNHSLHHKRAYAGAGTCASLPVGCDAARRTLALPLYAGLDDAAATVIAEVLAEVAA